MQISLDYEVITGRQVRTARGDKALRFRRFHRGCAIELVPVEKAISSLVPCLRCDTLIVTSRRTGRVPRNVD